MTKPAFTKDEPFSVTYLQPALIDRLLHHCHIVNIRGNSYLRRHHSELSGVLLSSTADENKDRVKKTMLQGC